MSIAVHIQDDPHIGQRSSSNSLTINGRARGGRPVDAVDAVAGAYSRTPAALSSHSASGAERVAAGKWPMAAGTPDVHGARIDDNGRGRRILRVTRNKPKGSPLVMLSGPSVKAPALLQVVRVLQARSCGRQVAHDKPRGVQAGSIGRLLRATAWGDGHVAHRQSFFKRMAHLRMPDVRLAGKAQPATPVQPKRAKAPGPARW